jgi:hypothetical protein
MFRIIGGDNKQYGPVTAPEVQEWIRLGRAGAQTQAQREGETEWKPLGSFPEFTDAFAGSASSTVGEAPSPGASPAALPSAEVPLDADRLAEEAMGRTDRVAIAEALGRSWDLLKADFWPIVGVTALITLLVVLVHSALVGVFVTGPFVGGLNWYLLKKLRGQPAQLSDAFAGFSSDFLQLFLGFLVSALLIGIGTILCVLPGIYLAVAWQFMFLLIMDHKLEFWPAMEVSRKVITKNWWGFFGFAIICALLNLLGTICCIVGVFVTIPWTMLAFVCLYENRFGPAPANR